MAIFEMGHMLRTCWDGRDVEKLLRLGKCWEEVDIPNLHWICHLLKARMGKMLRVCWEDVEMGRILRGYWCHLLQKLMQCNAETTSSRVPSYFSFRLLILVFVGCCGTRSGWVGWSGRSRCSSTPWRSSSTSSPWQGRKCHLRNNYFD